MDENIQSQITDLQTIETEFAKAQQTLNSMLAGMEEYTDFVDLETRVTEARKTLREAALEYLQKEDTEDSIETDKVKITLVKSRRLSAQESDLTGVPRKFVKKVLDTTKINKYHDLEGKLPAGVDLKYSESIRWTDKKEKK